MNGIEWIEKYVMVDDCFIEILFLIGLNYLKNLSKFIWNWFVTEAINDQFSHHVETIQPTWRTIQMAGS